jgi:uncharacterized protein (TIGR00251 family)
MTGLVVVRDTRGGAKFPVRVTPRASRTAIVGVIGEGDGAALRIALHAPPVEGRANAALIEFLSGLLGTPRSAIEISGGQHARSKTIVVRGRSAAEVSALLEKILPPTQKVQS